MRRKCFFLFIIDMHVARIISLKEYYIGSHIMFGAEPVTTVKASECTSCYKSILS